MNLNQLFQNSISCEVNRCMFHCVVKALYVYFPPNAWSLINGECKYKTFMFVLCQISTSVRAIRVNMMAFVWTT